jgi:Ca2+-binding EF-hand superfamily protein
VVALCLLLAGCGGSDEPRDPPPPVSPNGEPLVGAQPGQPGCEAALGAWLEAVDQNRDGALDRAEFMADATRWFARIDENGDGMVTPDELTVLRLRLMPPTTRGAETRGENLRQRYRDRDRRQMFGPTRAGPNDRPDPVMSADVNLDNRVTADEFLAQAARTFAGLDRNRDGRLTKDEVVADCAGRR